MNTSIYSSLILLNKNHNEHYLKRYVKLVSFYKERNWSEQFGLHEHHIIPESFGGPDTKENLVFITIREHFILHHLLYKAFPKSSMVTAFKAMCDGWGHYSGNKVTSKIYEKLMLEFIERQSETSRERQNKLVLEGTHPWQDGEMQRKNNLKRVVDGTHPFLDKEKARQRAKKRLENGTHISQIKKLCQHCKQEFSLGPFTKYHGDRCKLNPLFKEEKIECEHCKKIIDKSNFSVHHGNNCKLNPLFVNKSKPRLKIECEHCNRLIDITNFARWHGDKCKLNSPYKEEIKPKILCQHCNKEFDLMNFTNWHGDKCKLNPLYKEEIKEKFECPHCHRFFSKNTFTRYHSDNCKLKKI